MHSHSIKVEAARDFSRATVVFTMTFYIQGERHEYEVFMITSEVSHEMEPLLLESIRSHLDLSEVNPVEPHKYKGTTYPFKSIDAARATWTMLKEFGFE